MLQPPIIDTMLINSTKGETMLPTQKELTKQILILEQKHADTFRFAQSSVGPNERQSWLKDREKISKEIAKLKAGIAAL
jgi:hypothetical protein